MTWWLDIATILGWLLSTIFVLSLARLSCRGAPEQDEGLVLSSGYGRFPLSTSSRPVFGQGRQAAYW